LLTIRDLSGNEEILTDYKELTLNRKVNGEKSISLTILPTVHNEHSFPLVEEESIIDFDGEEYVIKKMQERNIGNTYIKRIDAIHKFYVDLINKQQPKVSNGSKTFHDYMTMVFEYTGYTFSVIDTFYAQSFENLGNDNRLSLLQKGLERYKAEMEIAGNDVRFKKLVGNDTDFQFRYAHNIKTIERNVDTTNLATVINGSGAEGITAYYRSPNADIFGEIDAPPVEDERFSTEDSLLTEMKARLQDTPEFSITIDFVDLRAAGYPWTVPNEGDRVYVIYEPMHDLLIETRILEIDEVYDANGNIIKTNVTLANYKKTFAGTMFDNVQKQLRNIVNEDGVVKYSVLDEAVRVATEALESAQTELEFENGIIARSKTNPNHLVLFNSAGIGVSTDGGNTFKTAMTGDGIVADVITGGSLVGIRVLTDDGAGNKIILENGEIRTYLGDTPVMSVDVNGLRMWHDNDLLAGTLRNEKDLNDPSKDGIELMAHQEYLALGFRETGTLINNPWIKLDRGPEIDQTTIYGSNVNGSDAGRLDLFSSAGRYYGKNGRVPRVSIRNFNDDTTKWAGMIHYIGRDYDAPGYDETQRFGFEVWQYLGTGDGAAEQLLKIDKDANGPTAMRVYTDSSYLSPNTYLKSGTVYDRALGIVLNSSIQNHGVPSGNPVLSMYEIPIDFSPGSAYSVKTTVNVSGARYIWAVYIQLRDGSANYFTATPTNISKTGYEIWTTINDGVNRDGYSGTQLTANVMVVMQRD
jgi:hypothetical protein